MDTSLGMVEMNQLLIRELRERAKIIFSQRNLLFSMKMVSFGPNIVFSLVISVISGNQDIHLDSEKANFGILEMKIDGNWVTGKRSLDRTC